jgi:tetratricopeptide (TPR) repeat protein
MANIWLRELYEAENLDGLRLEQWATAERLGIDGFNIASLANFYPQLYRIRYGDNEQGGFAFLESQMEGKEPSYGYSVLSYLLSETLHRVVITTNFDNLVADALSIHSSRFPLVIGHDALAQYATVELRRPLVAKIHGALGFSPKSKPNDISHLPKGWCDALRRILDRYTPIVIGYEGNDGSLMGFLKELSFEIPDRVFWCIYSPDVRGADCLKLVSPEVRHYVQLRRGRFVPIGGFDELMAKLLRKLGEKGSVPDLYENLKQRARKREQSYDEQQRKLVEKAKREPSAEGKSDPTLSEAVSEIAESRKDKPWWLWVSEADAERDLAAKEAIYSRGLEANPNDGNLLRSYAIFLETLMKDRDGADKYYKLALTADPDSPTTLVFYANFLKRMNPDKAEEYYQLALKADPTHPFALTEYVSFLSNIRKKPDEAEEVYVRTLEKYPADPFVLELYENFLRNFRSDSKKADEIQRRIDALK